jgi:CDP-diacylglycerol--glycerol-3-phosphate 3-phosphatidyltransferase
MPADTPSLARDLRTLPNLLTLARMVMVLIAVALFLHGSKGWGMAFGALAGVTDYLDGAIARATGQVTRLGEILDQFSDLVYESLLLSLVVVSGFASPWLLFAYLLRELWVATIRRFMAERRLHIPSSLLGKLKTNAIMWSFVPMFLAMADALPAWRDPLALVGRIGLAVGIGLGYLSGWRYTRAFVKGYDGPGL